MATRTKRRRRSGARRKNTPRRNAKGRFVKGSGRKARKSSRKRNPRRRSIRRVARRSTRRRNARRSTRRRSRGRKRNNAFASSIDNAAPRVANRRRRRNRRSRGRKRNNAFSASISRSAPRVANRRRYNRRRRNQGALVESIKSTFNPGAIGSALLGSTVRGLSGGVGMTIVGQIWTQFPAMAVNPIGRVLTILSIAAAGSALAETKMIGGLKGKAGFDPADINRGIFDQLRDVLGLAVASAMGPASPVTTAIGMFSPPVAAQLALAAAAPTDAKGLIAQATSGLIATRSANWGRRRMTRGAIVQPTAGTVPYSPEGALNTGGLSTMGGDTYGPSHG